MYVAMLERKRYLFSTDILSFECNSCIDYEFKPNSGLKLFREKNEIFSDEGTNKFFYKQQPTPVVEYFGANVILAIPTKGRLELHHVGSKWFKSQYEVILNGDKIAKLLFSSNFFPYTERYQLTDCVDKADNIDLLLFALFAWVAHETVCTF